MPDICHCLALRKANRHLTQLYDRHLAPVGLRITQLSILARLRHLGPCGMQPLAADLVMDRTTLGRNLGPLEREGLVAHTADPRDRRARLLTLTEAGTARLEAAMALWAEAQRAFEAAFGETEARELRGTLGRLAATPFEPAAAPAG
ncbi:MAG TPA: MarR family winged helix-turn-helix transcriptional regulator [Crenalkalicoccus sp.]|nr:MarR family winged helix-turn-helix transcriptional regulator [Crenalkalicoccus sp.]